VPFDSVYEALFPVIYRVSLHVTGDKEVAEDLCQEAFIKLMERPDVLPDLDQSRYWLIRVVKNLSLNHEKRRGRERVALSRLTRQGPPAAESSEGRVLREEARRDVQHALDQLPYTLRAPLVFREYGGLSYRDIGSILGITESNVKVRIFRARERLHRELSRGDVHVS
jgi:RNA polymerase sigma-70 factor (ECF subfamily)